MWGRPRERASSYRVLRGTRRSCAASSAVIKGSLSTEASGIYLCPCCPSRAAVASGYRRNFFVIALVVRRELPLPQIRPKTQAKRPRQFGPVRGAAGSRTTNKATLVKSPKQSTDSQRATRKEQPTARTPRHSGQRSSPESPTQNKTSNSQQQPPSRTITAVNRRGHSTSRNGRMRRGEFLAPNRCTGPPRRTEGLDAHHRKARSRPGELLPGEGR